MNPRWEESEFIFCDLQTAAASFSKIILWPHVCFWKPAYDSFEFLSQHPGLGRQRADLGFPQVRSWRIAGFQRYLIFYRELPGGIQIWRVLHGARDLEQTLNG